MDSEPPSTSFNMYLHKQVAVIYYEPMPYTIVLQMYTSDMDSSHMLMDHSFATAPPLIFWGR